jgi:glycosyltransferase involved in cell wall biosynthesis
MAWDRNIPLPIEEIQALKARLSEFDIVHVDLLRGFEAVAVHRYTQKYDIPYVLQPRGSVPYLNKSRLKKVFDVIFGQEIVADADKIIASSDIEQEQYPDVYPTIDSQKVVKIPNGIDRETYRDLPDEGMFRSQYGLSGDERIILYLSRIHERKGADLLLEAFESIEETTDQIRLVYVGPDDGYLGDLQAMVAAKGLSEKVLFTGPLYNEEKLAAYVDADIFVLPSKDKYESFGNVVLEALACGTPAIMTNNCGVSDWLSAEISETVPPSVPSITTAIQDLLSAPEKMRKMGESGRQIALENFDWSRVRRDTENVYKDILNRNT